MINDTILQEILKEYNNLEKEIEKETDFQKIGEMKKKLTKNTQLVEKTREYFSLQETVEWIKQLSEEEQKNLYDTMEESKQLITKVLEDIENIIINVSENHLNRNIFLEIRAGTGGDEASLFANELYIMYKRYALELGLRVEEMDQSHNEVGGLKSITILIKGPWSYKYFQFESGGHRVQRVPTTEKKGRVHTSTVTVAVLPEEDDNSGDFNLSDVKIEYSTAQGAGGQHVNKTESAVILIHIPTGIKVKIQDERSQHKNKEKAFKILRFRVKEALMEEEQQKLADARWSQVGSGERNEKIRTYNFPQNRLTDHRFNLTVYNLPAIMDGNFKPFFQSMILQNRNDKILDN